MSHIYQPLMLIELLKNNGTSTITDIAKALLLKDVSQIEYYENITKNMVIQNLPPKTHLLHKELEKEGFVFYTNVDSKLPWKSSIPV